MINIIPIHPCNPIPGGIHTTPSDDHLKAECEHSKHCEFSKMTCKRAGAQTHGVAGLGLSRSNRPEVAFFFLLLAAELSIYIQHILIYHMTAHEPRNHRENEGKLGHNE